MSPKETKVFVAEDEPEWREYYKRFLERAGHEIVLVAATLPDALRQVGCLEGKGVQVAIVDGNLSAGGWSGEDGRRVVEAIKEGAPGVKTVGMSGAGEVTGVDVNLGKSNIRKLGETVTNL